MCGNIDVLRASVRAGKPCWLQDENLLDELSDSERNYYNTLIAPVVIAPSLADKLQENMNRLESNTNQKLDAYHRINQMK
jgi:hypothetical protein